MAEDIPADQLFPGVPAFTHVLFVCERSLLLGHELPRVVPDVPWSWVLVSFLGYPVSGQCFCISGPCSSYPVLDKWKCNTTGNCSYFHTCHWGPLMQVIEGRPGCAAPAVINPFWNQAHRTHNQQNSLEYSNLWIVFLSLYPLIHPYPRARTDQERTSSSVLMKLINMETE